MRNSPVDLTEVARAARAAQRAIDERAAEDVVAASATLAELLARLDAERDELYAMQPSERGAIGMAQRHAAASREEASAARRRIETLERELETLRADGSEAHTALGTGIAASVAAVETEIAALAKEIESTTATILPVRERVCRFADITDLRLEIEEIEHRGLEDCRQRNAGLRALQASLATEIDASIAKCREMAASTAQRALRLKIGSNVAPPEFGRLVEAIESLRGRR